MRLVLALPTEVRTGVGGLVPQHVGRSACRQNPVTREPLLTEGCPRRHQCHRGIDLGVGAHCRMDGGGAQRVSGSVAGFRPFLYALCAGTWSHRPGRL